MAFRSLPLLFVMVASIAASSSAYAAACAEFDDVEQTSAFCTNVEWARSRLITSGCTGTTFCPSDPVSRLAMAAFLSRLGGFQTVALRATVESGVITVARPICTTTIVDPVDYDRAALVDFLFGGLSSASQAVSIEATASVDGVAPFRPMQFLPLIGSAAAGKRFGLRGYAGMTIAAGQSPAFQLAVVPDLSAAGGQLADFNCTLRVRIQAVTNVPSKTPVGVLLRGDRSNSARSALFDYEGPRLPPITAVRPGGGTVYRDLIRVELAPQATIGEVNDLVNALDGRIVAMAASTPFLSFRIPDPASGGSLESILTYVRSNSAVRMATLVAVKRPSMRPPNVSPGDLTFGLGNLAAGGFPAVWNVLGATLSSNYPTIVLQDHFASKNPIADMSSPITYDAYIQSPCHSDGRPVCHHGYAMAGIIGADFGGANTTRGQVTGAFPSVPIQILDANGVHNDENQLKLELDRQLAIPGRRVVVNYSMAHNNCPSARSIEDRMFDAASSLATLRDGDRTNRHAIDDRVIFAVAAGNVTCNEGQLSAEYHASDWATAGLVDLSAVPGYESTLRARNVLVVGSRLLNWSNGVAHAGDLDSDSYKDGNVTAVGTNALTFAAPQALHQVASGTSVATPLVASLAAHIWAFAPTLAPEEVIERILSTSRCHSDCNESYAIDAYAALLSADRGETKTLAPVRHALLDFNRDGKFDIADVRAFLDAFVAANGALDYSRFDLNGDGLTGGSATARFDLDINTPVTWGTVTRMVGGNNLAFNERSVSDAHALCYYVHGGMYQGDVAEALAEFHARQVVCAPPGCVLESDVNEIVILTDEHNSFIGWRLGRSATVKIWWRGDDSSDPGVEAVYGPCPICRPSEDLPVRILDSGGALWPNFDGEIFRAGAYESRALTPLDVIFQDVLYDMPGYGNQRAWFQFSLEPNVLQQLRHGGVIAGKLGLQPQQGSRTPDNIIFQLNEGTRPFTLFRENWTTATCNFPAQPNQ